MIIRPLKFLEKVGWNIHQLRRFQCPTIQKGEKFVAQDPDQHGQQWAGMLFAQGCCNLRNKASVPRLQRVMMIALRLMCSFKSSKFDNTCFDWKSSRNPLDQIGLVVTDGNRDLFADQEDTDGGEHPFDDRGWEETGDRTQTQNAETYLEQPGDHDREEERPKVAMEGNGGRDNGG